MRRARVNDAPAVGLVQAEVWRDSYAEIVPPEVLETFEPQAFAGPWRESLSNPPEGVWTLLVACLGQQVVGFVAVGPSQDPDADELAGEITTIAVHPAARRQGHGSRLLNAAVDILREAGAASLGVWALTTQEDVQSFLRSSGIQPDGAYRDRVVSPAGDTVREVRLTARLVDDASATD